MRRQARFVLLFTVAGCAADLGAPPLEESSEAVSNKYSAANIDYDNQMSQLPASDVQTAIDELAVRPTAPAGMVGQQAGPIPVEHDTFLVGGGLSVFGLYAVTGKVLLRNAHDGHALVLCRIDHQGSTVDRTEMELAPLSYTVVTLAGVAALGGLPGTTSSLILECTDRTPGAADIRASNATLMAIRYQQ